MANDYVDQVRVKGVDYDLRAGFESDVSIRTDAAQNLTPAQQSMARRNLGLSVRYGFRREKNNSDPDSRITYLYDAVGMAPAKMTFDAETGVGTFDYGGWENFCNSIARPVMLRTSGIVAYELDHEDQTKKLDGTESDIANTAFDGNAMVEFGKAFQWVKRFEDEDYEYVIFSDVQYDETYHAYAHMSNGTVHDAFYIGMFTGPYNSNILRSLATGGNAVSQNAENEIARAKANGEGHYILYKSAWDYISDLLTLISKTDNSQAAFGSGIDNRKNSITAPGSLKDKGPFYGTNDGLVAVKVFWIENYWGNMWQRMAGCINDNGTVKCKMTGPYCDTPVSAADYSGYVSAAVTPTGSSGGYAKVSKCGDEIGTVPYGYSGSSTTYLCDGGWFNNSQLDFAFVGAYYGGGAGFAGSRCLSLSTLASYAPGDDGSRLSYLPA